MNTFKILVPISFGIQSDIALKQAKSIAQQMNAKITCLHVIQTPELFVRNLFSREMEPKALLKCEFELASKVNSILSGDDSVSFELMVTSGKIYQKILEKASELDIDMIIMGRSDASNRKKSSLGTNAARIIKRSDIPVLTIRNMEAHSYRHVLVPLDLSAPVSLQLAKVIELAELLNAMVTVCTILHSSKSELETVYRRRLINIEKLFTKYDISCRVKLIITEKRVVDEILSCSKRYKPNLLILMTQEEAEITDLSVGSVANELICKSEIPVLSLSPVLRKDRHPHRSLFGFIDKSINQYGQLTN